MCLFEISVYDFRVEKSALQVAFGLFVGCFQSNSTHISYCYNIIYSPYDSQPFMLLLFRHLETVISTACCFVPKNGQAATAFIASQSPAIPIVHSSNLQELGFNLTCYRDESLICRLCFIELLCCC